MTNPRSIVETFSDDPQPVVFAHTHRAIAHTARSYPAFFMSSNTSAASSFAMSSSSSQSSIPIIRDLPIELQGQIFSFARTISAARLLTICKENKATIEATHEGFRAAHHGVKIQKETIEKLKKGLETKFSSLPLWLFTKDYDALELIGKEILNLTKLYEESINNPSCFIDFIFDKRILRSLQKNFVSFDQIVDLLTLRNDPQANDTVDALFRSQECRDDLLQRLGAILSAEEALKASGVIVDKVFVAEFLEKELHGSQCYEMELENLVTLYSKERENRLK